MLRVRVVHGEEELAILLGGEPVIDLGHFAIEIYQFGRLNAAVGRLGIELPTDVVALGPAIVMGLPTGVGKRILALGTEEPELINIRK